MTRAFRILALLAAFLVFAARSAGGLPFAVATLAQGYSGNGISGARSSTNAPLDQDTSAVADFGDDADDGVDALIAAAPVRLVALVDEVGAALRCSPWVDERALPSHALTLDRPPRV